jgi:hypothetical protein
MGERVDVRAKITSKGQLTIPRSFLSLAGSVPVPAAKRGTRWDDVLRQTRRSRAERRR